jgi:hypothetical protein
MIQITTLEVLKKYARASNDFTVDELVPFETIAKIAYLNAFFQKELQEEIFSFISEEEESEKERMYQSLMAALVNFTMYEYSLQGEVIVSDNGIMRSESESAKTAYSGQIKKYQGSLIDVAYLNIGTLIDLLEKTEDAALIELWEASPAYSGRADLLVKSAVQFHSVQRLYRHQTTFIELIPTIRIVQQLFFVPGIGETLLAELIANASDMDANKKIARTHLITALVNITMAEAMKIGMVKLSTAGAITIGQDKDTSFQLEEKGMPDHVSITHNQYMDIGLRFVDQAKKQLASSGFIEMPTTAPKRFRV